MAIERLLRANRQVLAIPMCDDVDGQPLLVGANGDVCPFAVPTTAIINSWVTVNTTLPAVASNGGNISCALLDDLSLGLADPETDTELTICSRGNESSPTSDNVEATLTGFRDKNKADTGVFNLYTQLMNAADVRYALMDRIDSPSDSLVEVGDVISLYEVDTDNPVDIKEDRGNLKLQQTPAASGTVNHLYTLLS